jgi:hypothetical protein
MRGHRVSVATDQRHSNAGLSAVGFGLGSLLNHGKHGGKARKVLTLSIVIPETRGAESSGICFQQ